MTFTFSKVVALIFGICYIGLERCHVNRKKMSTCISLLTNFWFCIVIWSFLCWKYLSVNVMQKNCAEVYIDYLVAKYFFCFSIPYYWYIHKWHLFSHEIAYHYHLLVYWKFKHINLYDGERLSPTYCTLHSVK